MPEETIETGHSSARGYPYNFGREELDFAIESYQIDGGEDSGTPRGSDRTVDLYRFGSWETATVEGTVELDSSTVDFVFPEDERREGSEPPGELVLVLDCEATQDRHVVDRYALTDECSVTVNLERSAYRGRVELYPVVVRTRPASEGLPYAPHRDLRVADGPTWTIHVDEPIERGSGFPTRYLDFGDASYPVELVHALNQNPGDPRILVNDDIDELVDVLQSGGHSGFRPRLRDVLRREIAMMAWIQLVWWTWASITETGECEYEWQEGIVEELSPLLFEEDLDQDEAIERFGENLDGPGEVRGFVRDLNQAVQLYVDHRGYLETFIEREAP